jgi:folate-binding protein YgfZ
MPAAFLKDRCLIRVTGAEAESFLQNLITTDLTSLAADEARPGALLTPQGKILFDFMIWRDGNGFMLECDASLKDSLSKRLFMYRLRAQVEISAAAQDGVAVSWGEDATAGVKDCRFAKAGVALARQAGDQAGPASHDEAARAAYDALRIDSGIAESGKDFALSDAFPHDVMMDLNGGLSFRKGCYVGQEVVSRMQHRGTARRRVVIVSAEGDLPETGAEISAGGKPVGTLGSTAGRKGLAIVRIDRAGEAIATGTAILAGGSAVTLALPAWSGLSFPEATDEATA